MDIATKLDPIITEISGVAGLLSALAEQAENSTIDADGLYVLSQLATNASKDLQKIVNAAEQISPQHPQKKKPIVHVMKGV